MPSEPAQKCRLKRKLLQTAFDYLSLLHKIIGRYAGAALWQRRPHPPRTAR
ncbi:TPA: hypothetical protein ACJLYO_001734 [Neisseria meningitidis]